MSKSRKPTDNRKPVAQVVHSILEQARIARTDGPTSGLYGRDAQLSSALTQAGRFLAKLDNAAPPKRTSAMHLLIGSLGKAPVPKRRSWLFSGKQSAMPDAKQIDKLLQAATKDARPLVLDAKLPANPSAVNEQIDCVLPPGAIDPVCEPR